MLDTTAAKEQIKQDVDANDVVLFMKGTRTMPQCGFSSRVASILTYMGIEFHDVNILASDEMRQGIKEFSDWPTTPQLYVKQEFVGGCDIVTEMTISGEMDQLLDDKGVTYDKDAANKIREAIAKQPKLEVLRKVAKKSGNRSLQDEGVLLVAQGITSLAELSRALKS